MTHTPTSGNAAWFLLLILTLGSFSLGMAEFTTIWLLPNLAADLNTPLAQIGNTASYYALGVLVGGPFLSFCGANLSRQNFLTLLLIWCCVGNLTTSLVSNWEQLQWMRFFGGMPHGAYLGIATMLLKDTVPKHQFGSAIGILMAGIGMALLIIVPMTTYFGAVQDWRLIFRFVALIDVLIILLLHDLMPKLPTSHQRGFAEIKILKQPMVLWILAISATAICGRMAIFANTEPLMLHITRLSHHQLPLIVICGGIGTILGFLVGGYFADKNPLKTVGLTLVWCLIIISLFHELVQHPTWVYWGFFLLGTFVLIVPSLQLLSIQYAPEGATFSSCLNHSAMNIANAAGPFLASLVIGAGFGWLSVTWVGWAVGGLAVLIFALGVRIWRPNLRQQHPKSESV